MRSLWPSRHQWGKWSLPSKLTAIGALVGILSFGGYLLEKGYPLLRDVDLFNGTDDVHLVLEFDNQTNHRVSLYSRGETFYWFPGGAEYTSYAFEVVSIGDKEGGRQSISIPQNSKVRALIKLLPSEVARNYLDQGHMSVSVLFRGNGGMSKMSPSVGFSKTNIEGGYIPMVFEKTES